MAFFLPFLSFLTLIFLGRQFGRALSLMLSIIFSSITSLIFLFYSFNIFFYGARYIFILGDWFAVGDLLVSYKFIYDPLSITFATLISFITLLILIYSYDYLREDPHLVKFYAYLNFFQFSMSCLVLAGNYVVMFLGWEGVGLASYLLINFWSSRNQANKRL